MSDEEKHTNSTLIKPVSESVSQVSFSGPLPRCWAEVPGAGIPPLFLISVQDLEPHLPQELRQFLPLLHFVFGLPEVPDPEFFSLHLLPCLSPQHRPHPAVRGLPLSSRATAVPLAQLHLVGWFLPRSLSSRILGEGKEQGRCYLKGPSVQGKVGRAGGENGESQSLSLSFSLTHQFSC